MVVPFIEMSKTVIELGVGVQIKSSVLAKLSLRYLLNLK